MRRFGRLSALCLLIAVGCGGAKPAPPAAPPPASAPVAKEPIEKADLSPVKAPAELFVVGRLRRPGPLADTLGKWAGLPVSLRTLLGRELHGLETVIAWDAPIELAIALPASGRRHGVRTVVSVGMNSLGGMLNALRERGLSPERILPEVFGFAGPSGVRCAVGPALGSASARLVCGERASDVEELFAYATRGLPNENLGDRDLEVDLRAEPLRKRFASEISGMRLFAGFLLRQAELDNPRFDRALADAAYGVADELALEVEDTDSLKLEGSLDEPGKAVSLELAWRFRSTRSWLANLTNEFSRRAGPPPAAFGRLPGDATNAGYTVDLRSERWAPVQTAVSELVDAYLEYEHLGKKTRESAKRAFGKIFDFAVASVQSKGEAPAGAKVSDVERRFGWRLTRGELPLADVDRALSDVHALVGDRELWKALAKRFDLDPKSQPKSELAPLKGKGIPAGARSLTITIPAGLLEGLVKSASSGLKVETKEAVKLVLAAAPDGKSASVMVLATDKKEAGERLSAFLAEGGQRVGERNDLGALTATRALHAEFFTLLGLVDSLAEGSAEKRGALLPNHGQSAIVTSYTAKAGPPLVFSATLIVPAAALADLPGIATSLSETF